MTGPTPDLKGTHHNLEIAHFSFVYASQASQNPTRAYGAIFDSQVTSPREHLTHIGPQGLITHHHRRDGPN